METQPKTCNTRVRIISILSSGLGSDFTKAVRIGDLGPDFIYFEPGSGFYPSSLDPVPDIIHFWVRLRVRVRFRIFYQQPSYIYDTAYMYLYFSQSVAITLGYKTHHYAVPTGPL